jgi:hypothetical protein
MLRMIMVPLLAILSVCVWLNSSSAADSSHTEASRSTNGYASPKQAFNAYRQANITGDWRTLFKCLTPEAQDRELNEVYFRCAMQTHKLEVTSVMDRFGLAERKVDDELGKIAAKGGNAELALKSVVCKMVSDRVGFFVAAAAATGLGPMPPERIGDLTNLQISGDVATGEFTTLAVDQPIVDPSAEPTYNTKVQRKFSLRRIGGKWFIE